MAVCAAEGHHLHIFLTKIRRSRQNNLPLCAVADRRCLPEHELPAIDVWINLAGKSIFHPLDRQGKRGILSNRIKSTQEVRRILEAHESKPSVPAFKQSAVGIYGTSQTGDFTEESPPADTDFLSHTSKLWEAEGQKIEALGIRTVYTTFGVVGKGTLPLMTLPYKLFAGRNGGWLCGFHGFMSKDAYLIMPYTMTTSQVTQCHITESCSNEARTNDCICLLAPSLAERSHPFVCSNGTWRNVVLV
ncbi:hypothetical protein ACEQPO_06465 [Bacillus sp. SL00103]